MYTYMYIHIHIYVYIYMYIYIYMYKDGGGYISLDELDPKTFQEIGSYRALVHKLYGNMLNCWVESIDVHKRTQVDEDDFVGHCLVYFVKFACSSSN